MKLSKLKAWLEILRSGKYEQLTERLMNKDCTAGCCLGLYLVGPCGLSPRGFTGTAQGDVCTFGETEETTVLPEEIYKADGFFSESGGAYEDRAGHRVARFETSKGLFSGLAEANDLGVSFTELADIIEADPLLFFRSIENDIPDVCDA